MKFEAGTESGRNIAVVEILPNGDEVEQRFAKSFDSDTGELEFYENDGKKLILPPLKEVDGSLRRDLHAALRRRVLLSFAVYDTRTGTKIA